MPHTILKVEQFDFSHFSRECGNFIFDATSISCNVNKVRVVLNLFCYRAKPNCKVRVCNCNSKLVQLEKWVAPFKKLRPESVSKRILRMRANGTRMPLNGVQMHQKVSRRFQKFPEVSECIRITVVSALNWPVCTKYLCSRNWPVGAKYQYCLCSRNSCCYYYSYFYYSKQSGRQRISAANSGNPRLFKFS